MTLDHKDTAESGPTLPMIRQSPCGRITVCTHKHTYSNPILFFPRYYPPDIREKHCFSDLYESNCVRVCLFQCVPGRFKAIFSAHAHAHARANSRGTPWVSTDDQQRWERS